MATAKMCDVCGKFYRPYDTDENDQTRFNSIACLNMDDNGKYYSNTPKDLCQECQLKLTIFFNSKGEVLND